MSTQEDDAFSWNGVNFMFGFFDYVMLCVLKHKIDFEL